MPHLKSTFPAKNHPQWIQVQEKAKERALEFMHDPDLDHYAKEFIIGSLSENTLKAYASDLKIFRFWCEDRAVPYLPASPATVANFLAVEANKNPPIKASTIKRRSAAIRYVHRMADLEVLPTDSSIVSKTLKGIMRKKRMAPHKKEPTTNTIIHQMVEAVDLSTLTGLRDRAILLLGFAGAFRRSELVQVRVEDLKIHEKGMTVHIPKSKTDQLGEGDTIPVLRGEQHCPVNALQAWLSASGISNGFVFRRISKAETLWPSHDDLEKPDLCAHSIALIVKKYAKKVNLNPDLFSGHSLRHGFTTSSLEHGAALEKVMAVTRHKNPKTTLGYYKDLKKFEDHAGEGLL